jgi:starch synthase
MRVGQIAFECAPIYKTRGLGDVVGSLPIVLKEEGVESIVLMPRYEWIMRPESLPGSSVPVYYVKSPWFAKPNTAHDPKIQAPKYAHFALQALEELKRLDIKPDILHCHDWHTGLVPFLLKMRPDAFFEKTKILLTVHNIAYQGKFPTSYLEHPETQVILDSFDKHQKQIAYLKLGIESADFISTVSPNHAHEIRTGQAGFGLAKSIRQKRGKFIGIINGIDYKIWSPKIDNLIFTRYSSKTVQTGKAKNKTLLQKHLGLEVNPSIPVFGFIARLSAQKGIDLLLPLFADLASRRIQVVILGQGERKYIKALKKYQNQTFKDWISVNF